MPVIHQTDDRELLRQFATENSEAAFAALVERHIGLVYCAAQRQTGNSHAAEEITQAVFIILARKAGSLGGKVVQCLCSGFIRISSFGFQTSPPPLRFRHTLKRCPACNRHP